MIPPIHRHTMYAVKGMKVLGWKIIQTNPTIVADIIIPNIKPLPAVDGISC